MTGQVRRVGQHAIIYALVRQELLAELLESTGGAGQFSLDILSHEIRFSDSLHGRCHLLASIAVDPASMVWAYSPMFAQQVGPDPLAARIRDFGNRHQLDQLTTEENFYEVPAGSDQRDVVTNLSHDVGALGVEVFGPDVLYYSFPTGNAGSRGVVLVDQLSTPVRKVELADVMVRLPRLVQQVDDLDWSLEGLAHLAGWRLEQQPGDGSVGYRLTDADGAWFSLDVTRDRAGRMTNISFNGINQPGS